MDKLLITNARLVNEGQVRDADVLIEGERIAQIGSAIAAPDGVEVIDAAGKILMPGMIDDQVHFREPGMTYKGDLATESAAAAAGGITSFMDMPNVNPQTTTREALADKYRIAEHRCTANYAFYFGATNRNIEEIKGLEVDEACGIKAFMGASTGDMLVDDPEALEKLFEHAPLLVATHCEHSPTIWDNEAKARAEFGEHVPLTEHPNIRSAGACLTSSSMAVDLARRHDARAARATPDDGDRDGVVLEGAPLRETHYGRGLRASPVVRRVAVRATRLEDQVQSGDQERRRTGRH